MYSSASAFSFSWQTDHRYKTEKKCNEAALLLAEDFICAIMPSEKSIDAQYLFQSNKQSNKAKK